MQMAKYAIALVILASAVVYASESDTNFRGYANIDDIRLYYEDHGEGEPVILLHGGTASGAETWSRTVPALLTKYRVIVPDSRAHGRSTDSEKPLSYGLLTDDIVELMNQLKLPQAHVIGWSDGGIIGLNMAQRYPDRLHSLVAYGANFHHNGLPENMKEYAQNLSPETRPVWLADLVYRNIAPDPTQEGVLISKVKKMWLSEPTWTIDDLSSIQVPVLIVEDSLGKAIRPEHTFEMHEAIPESRLEFIDGTNHAAPMEQAEKFNQLVLDFLGLSKAD